MSQALTEKRRIRQSVGDRVFGWIIYSVLALFVIAELYPLVYVVSASFTDPKAITSGEMILWPVRPTLQGYQYIFNYKEIWTGYANTLFYTVVGTVVNLVVTLPAAYALSRRDFKDKTILMLFFMFTMYFSGGLIPAYLNIHKLGLLNTVWVMIIAGPLSVYNMIVARTFFANSIPWELHEAARIDGAGNFRTFFNIVLPLSSPIIVVLTLYYGVGHWNAYFNAMIYLAKARNLWPLQMFLRDILIKGQFASSVLMEADGLTPEQIQALMQEADTANMVKFCVIIASTLPMMIIYPWLQKFFAKGVMIGSVKG